ncbi:MAG: hypothetical protein AB7N65_25990 [Vicinamibacterales bacterium]
MTTQTTKHVTLTLSLDEVNLILEGLGNLPFARVYTLIGRMQEQASAQLAPPAAPAPDTSTAPLSVVASR